ncbi:MAG: DUF4270 family protein [Bacteroidota bacterium]
MIKKIFGVLSVFLLVLACSVDSSDIPTLEVGQEFTDSDIRVLVLDTFAVRVSTFKFDSINTSSSARLLVGQYTDSFVGKVRTSNYFELSAQNYELPEDAELDSIALILGYDRYFYSDTTLVSQINVHLLTEEVDPEEDVFFNTSTLNFDSIPLVTRNYRPEPFDEDSLHISIPTLFGQQIFNLIQGNDINDLEELREIFKGFSLQPGREDNSSVIGFSRDQDRTYLRFFYSIPTEFEDDEESFDLFINPFSLEPNAFNNITSDVSGTVLDQLTDEEIDLSSTDSQDLSYIQAGVGLAVKLEFPNIRKVFEIPGTGTFLNANLQIKPPRSSYGDVLPLRDSLNVSVSNQNNDLTQVLLDSQGGLALGRITGEEEEFNDVIYEIPIGTYIEQKIIEDIIVDDALVLFTEEYNSTVNRIVLQGEENSDFEATLILTYAIYDE